MSKCRKKEYEQPLQRYCYCKKCEKEFKEALEFNDKIYEKTYKKIIIN